MSERLRDYYVVYEYDPDVFPPTKEWKGVSYIAEKQSVLIQQVHGASSVYDACEQFIARSHGDTNNMRIMYVGRMPNAGDSAIRMTPVDHRRKAVVEHTFFIDE